MNKLCKIIQVFNRNDKNIWKNDMDQILLLQYYYYFLMFNIKRKSKIMSIITINVMNNFNLENPFPHPYISMYACGWCNVYSVQIP